MVTIHELVEKLYLEKTKDPIKRLNYHYFSIITSSCSAYDNDHFNRLCEQLSVDILYWHKNPIRTESFINMMWNYENRKWVQSYIKQLSLIL